jgi:hypothetical protein
MPREHERVLKRQRVSEEINEKVARVKIKGGLIVVLDC